MQVKLITDRDSATALSQNLTAGIVAILRERGHEVRLLELGREDAAPCRGCLLCFTKHPGECVSKDIVNELIKAEHHRKEPAATVFVTPVLFGHPCSTIKNAMDRGAGSRYQQVIVGYGSSIDDEEKSTFIDIYAKHRGRADIVHPGVDREVAAFVTRSEADNAVVCEALGELVS
jgi:multimeric flavodoxin WrbA